jgi:sugar lactone lactonase YvrE
MSPTDSGEEPIFAIHLGESDENLSAQVLLDGTRPELVAEGFGLLGAAVPGGAGTIIFSDIDHETIHRLDLSSREITVMDANSGARMDCCSILKPVIYTLLKAVRDGELSRSTETT